MIITSSFVQIEVFNNWFVCGWCGCMVFVATSTITMVFMMVIVVMMVIFVTIARGIIIYRSIITIDIMMKMRGVMIIIVLKV